MVTEYIEKRVSSTVKKFREEFRKNVVTAMLAAFAFIIALAWRDAITDIINEFVKDLNITEGIYAFRILYATVITIISVIGIIAISRWSEEKAAEEASSRAKKIKE
ncbi:MAG: DUF5654 family protein [Nanoarchaeota archaeon]